MCNLGLLPKRKEENLHGFIPRELNTHFAGIFVLPFENIEEAMYIILPANEEGFYFKPVDFNTVVLAISHFFSQVKSVGGVPQKVVAKVLPVISNYLVKILNSSFAHGIFPKTWKQAQIIALKKK